MVWVAAGVASAGIVSSVIASDKAAKTSKKQTKFQNQIILEQLARKNRIADQLEAIAQKLLSEQPLTSREQSFIAASAKIADQQLQRIQKESIESGLEAQAGTGFLKSGRMADQVRRLVLEGAEGRSKVALTREQATISAIQQNRAQALQALSAAGGFSGGAPQFATPVGNPLAAFGAGLTAIGGAGLQGGGFNFGQPQQQPLTQVDPNVVGPNVAGPNTVFPPSAANRIGA